MFIGVDGTSAAFYEREAEETYRETYRNSFVSQLHSISGHSQKHYFQGPNLLSSGERDLLTVRNEVLGMIQTFAERDEADRTLVMAGYSRGAAICIAVAMEIQNIRETSRWANRIICRCLILFDAVGLDIHSDTAIIPGNVEYAFHAIRDSRTNSRSTWGNTGTQAQDLVVFDMQPFMSSHAGMGGTIQTSDYFEGLDSLIPDVADLFSDGHSLTREQDLAGSAQVRQWMWRNTERFIRINPDSAGESSSDYIPRRLSNLLRQLTDFSEQLSEQLEDRSRERLERERGSVRGSEDLTPAGRADMEQITAVVLLGMTSSFEDWSVLSDAELTTIEHISLEDWVDIISTAFVYRRSGGRVSWSGDRLVQSGYETAATGTVGRLGEVIMRRISAGIGLTAARNRARETGVAVAGSVRYIDRMYSYHPGEEYEMRQLTDGAYIGIYDNRLYIFGIAEVKSGRNFSDLIGDSGQLSRDIRRIRNGGLIVPMSGSRLSNPFTSENIIFSPETTDWYLGGPADEIPAHDYFSRDLSEININSYQIISLVLERNNLRTLAGIINSNLPEEE